MSKATSRTISALAILACGAGAARASEGMWTFDNFPIAAANRELGTNVDQAWLDRVRGASAKVGGCSAGLVSAEGLVLTNNHCVTSCVQDLSTPAQQYALTGFTPGSRAGERQCPGMQVEILTAISDITQRMQKAGAGLQGQAFTKARDAEAGRIESEACGKDDTRRCQVVTLYRGGQFKLYTYRKYTDVRLAYAPEERAASFGGDLDNFSFPRFSVDAAFVRIYENGKPVATPNHFRWNAAGPKPGEPIFVSGTPGATQRLLTQDQLASVRDVMLPLEQLINSELRGRLIRFSQESDEKEFIARDALAGVENTYKRGIGRMKALIDSDFIAARQASEADFKGRVAADPRIAAAAGDPWKALSEVQDDVRALHPAYYMLEARAGGGSQLFNYARTLVRGAQERAKPSAERLPEYGDARLSTVERQLLAERTIYPELERLQLDWWLSKTREILTVDDPRVRPLLGKEAPQALAARLVSGSRLADPAVRRRLWEGGLAAVQASDDPMIRYLLSIQEPTRAVRSTYEDRVQAPTDRASEALAAARFAAYGTSLYPDATGTHRLTFGRVEGWTYEGKTVAPTTTFAGLYDRVTGAAPFDMAPKWIAARNRIDPKTVLNVAASTDTIGGSSGSPAINAKGEIVGANFDSTALTQRNAYGYDPAVNRSVLVSTSAITAALRDVYG